MTYTYDPAEAEVYKVRLLIPDHLGETEAIFTDEEIETLLELEGGSIRRAAALGKETIAGDQVLLLKVVTHLDVTVDGAAVARSLLEQATRLRDLDAAEEESDDVDVIEMQLGTFSVREQIVNEAVRDE